MKIGDRVRVISGEWRVASGEVIALPVRGEKVTVMAVEREESGEWRVASEGRAYVVKVGDVEVLE